MTVGPPEPNGSSRKTPRVWLAVAIAAVLVIAAVAVVIYATSGMCPSSGSGAISLIFGTPVPAGASRANLSFTVSIPSAGPGCGFLAGGGGENPPISTQDFWLEITNVTTGGDIPGMAAPCEAGQNISSCSQVANAPGWYGVLFDHGGIQSTYPAEAGSGNRNWTSDATVSTTGEQLEIIGVDGVTLEGRWLGIGGTGEYRGPNGGLGITGGADL